MFSINYVKNKNAHILATLDDISKIQNYVPLYKEFFSLNATNFNSINLNHKWHITEFVQKNDENKYICTIKNEEQKKKVPSFFKFSPLVDPIKFLVGKYRKKTVDVLPSLEKTEGFSKLNRSNNAAYVDSFFSFLSSKAIHTHGFYHGVDFYGSFLAIKDHFHYNIADDIDYLCESEFFQKNKGDKFSIDSAYEELFSSFNTRNYKRRLKLGDSLKITLNDTLPLDEKSLNEVFINDDISKNNIEVAETASTNSSMCSSRSSHTSNGSDGEDEDEEDKYSDAESQGSGSTGSLSTLPDDVIEAILKKFPVQIICLEKMDNTLNSLLEDNDENEGLNNKEWSSCLFQIIIHKIRYST